MSMGMYTNQTAEELDSWRCTSDGIFKAQNSIFMKINFGFVYILSGMTFVLSFKAARILTDHNVYSHGSQILLMFTLINANLNQAVFLEIRIRHLIHVLTFATDPCKIEFHSSECTYDQTIYAFSSGLSTWLVSALTCDRFIAYFASSVYSSYSKTLSYLLSVSSITLALIVHLIVYGEVSRAGYVPSCHYPPQLSLNDFQTVNNANFIFIMINCVLTIAILVVNILRDNKIKQSVYDTKTRYNSYENVLTTKAICSITSTQFAFLSFANAAVTIIRFFEAGMSEEVFHITAQYVSGILYGNLAIPILIYLKTKQCIEKRRISIDRMTSQPDHMDAHIASLREAWES